MIHFAGDYFLKIATGEFWSQMHRNPLKFEQCLKDAVEEFGMPVIARIMPNCASRFCDDKYRDLIYVTLRLGELDRMTQYCVQFGSRLVKLESFSHFYARTPLWKHSHGRALIRLVEPDDKPPLGKVEEQVWLQLATTFGVIQGDRHPNEDSEESCKRRMSLFNQEGERSSVPRTLENLRAEDQRCLDSIAADDQPMVAVPNPAAAAKKAPAKADDDDFDLLDIDNGPKKAAPKRKAAKEGGAAVAKAAPKKAATKATAKEDSPVAAHDKPARARKPMTYKLGDSDDDMEDDDDSFQPDDSDDDYE
jgi:hypothetical protein